MEKLPVLIFDWDGVIVDSNAWKWGGAWQEVFVEEPELFRLMDRVLLEDQRKSLDRQQLVARVFELAQESGTTPQRAPEEYVERFGEAVRLGVARIGLFPGALSTLEALHIAGYHMYVISMTTQEDLEYLADQLGVGRYFVRLYGTPGKKFEHAQDIRQTEVSQSYVVIGDGEGDRSLAKEVQASFVGILNQWNHWADDSSLMHKVDSIVDVPKVLQRMIAG